MEIDFSGALDAARVMGNDLVRRLPYILVGILVFVMFHLSGKGVHRLIRRMVVRRTRHRQLALVIGRLAQGATSFLGLLVALVIMLPTLKPAQIVQLLGISSVAIGFAFRDILQNFLAGILILLTRPFRIDDQIRYGEFEGTIEDIQTRATLIRTYDGRRVVIPNGSLFTSSVIVNTAFEQRRIEYDLGIGYGDDVDTAKQVILDAVNSVEGVLADPPADVLVFGLAPSSITIRVRWWITPPRRFDALDSRDRVLAAIRKALAENGIDIPFPTQTILFHDQTDECDGDRTRQREGWPPGQSPPRPRSIAGALHALAGGLRSSPERSPDESQPTAERGSRT